MAKRKAADSVATDRSEQAGAAKKARARRISNDDKIVERANVLDSEAFQECFLDSSRLTYQTRDVEDKYTIALKASADMTNGDLNACFNLIEATSRADYEPSSFGWHPKRKRREMREPEMRYLLIRRRSENAGVEEPLIEGFLSFMITHDSDPPVPVLYVYEVHLSEIVRKFGLGAHLMQAVEGVAERVGVQKVMLTCFLSNAKALHFYERRGYAADVCTPGPRRTRHKVVKPDYVIMSKTIGPSSSETDHSN